MTKAAHLLTTLIFAVVCAALWGAWWLGERYLGSALGDGGVSTTMEYALMAYPWVFALLPVPAVIYSAVLMDRVEILPEKVLLYFVLMVFVSLVLISATGVLFTLELQGIWTHQSQTLG